MSRPGPDVHAVRARTAALANVVQVAVVAPPSRIISALAELDETKRQALREQLDVGPAQLRSSLMNNGVWDNLTPDEQWYLSTPPDKVPHDDWAAGFGEIEALGTLLWALGFLQALPSYADHVGREVIDLCSKIQPGTGTLRPIVELERARTTAEIWHWRARARLLATGVLDLPSGVTATDVEMPVAQVVQKATLDGILTDVVADDFAVHGRPFCALGADEATKMAAIAQRRHKALNWICGYAPGNRWQDTPTNT